MAESKCLPRVPYEKWALDNGVPGGEKDWANWKYLRVWAQRLLDDCMGVEGACEDDLEFSLAGQVIAGLVSAPEPVDQGHTFDRVTIVMNTPSSDDVTVDISRINSDNTDTNLYSITLPAGDRLFTETGVTSLELSEEEAFFATVATADGGDGIGLTVRMWGSCAEVPNHTGSS